jgi:hypothetical protein
MIKPKIKLNPLEKTAVNVPTPESYVQLMRVFESGDWKWRGGNKPTAYGNYGFYSEDFCIGMGIDEDDKDEIGHAPEYYWLKQNVKVISSEKFYEQQKDVTPEKLKEINAYFDWKEKQT